MCWSQYHWHVPSCSLPRAQEDLSVCPSAQGNAGQVLGAEGDGLAAGISDQIFPVTHCRDPPLSPDVLRLEALLIIRDRTTAWFA